MVTAKELELAKRRVALIRNPGTPEQRVVRIIDGTRLDHRASALAWARSHYPDQPLAWLQQTTGETHPVED